MAVATSATILAASTRPHRHAERREASRCLRRPTEIPRRARKDKEAALIPDPWVQNQVGYVRQEIHHHVQDRAKQRDAHDDVEVQRRDRADREAAYAWPREDRLDQELPGDQRGHLEGDDRHDRDRKSVV